MRRERSIILRMRLLLVPSLLVLPCCSLLLIDDNGSSPRPDSGAAADASTLEASRPDALVSDASPDAAGSKGCVGTPTTEFCEDFDNDMTLKLLPYPSSGNGGISELSSERAYSGTRSLRILASMNGNVGATEKDLGLLPASPRYEVSLVVNAKAIGSVYTNMLGIRLKDPSRRLLGHAVLASIGTGAIGASIEELATVRSGDLPIATDTWIPVRIVLDAPAGKVALFIGSEMREVTVGANVITTGPVRIALSLGGYGSTTSPIDFFIDDVHARALP
jgi:hypothetical protein